ncbi:methionyl-tRNA formyltransferase [Anaerotignum sp. MSJ-24]|uniref:methionyl-tRNA formyltransferase n=1 Tax=Anaerotignum sp. MSJ-24 TaxID=2841521 RepID=UPI001C108179|nr:methionyl-tRNA formyltransferase [Anaerotignum sp. MSJ-24]MBU5464878.1 methionyl-tRNA formyltransferase [Anaerotignum sp. MSJ-24]
MRVIFMGTPDFAVPTLEALIEKHEVLAVVTQPDKPKGRGKKMVFPVVKEKALEHNITVYQPQKVKTPEFVEILKEYQPDIMVVVAFGQILSEEILNIPKYGCINVHGSILPQYRGAAPIQWSIINGEEFGGVTTMYMAKGLDSGDMILKAKEKIKPDDTYGSLYDRLSVIGADLLIKTLDLIENGEVKRIPQNDDEATFAPMIKPELEHINWNGKNTDIVNLIKGLNPQPVAYTMLNDEKLKIWFAETIDGDYNGEPGTIVDVRKRDFVVMTAEGAVAVKEVQAQGGKRMSADAYMRGHAIEKGTILK